MNWTLATKSKITPVEKSAERGEEKTVMIDATNLKVHRTAASMGVKMGGGLLIGRTKGGTDTKLHAACDMTGRPINIFVNAGQVSGYIGAKALLNSLPKAGWLLGDRGCDADWFREALKRQWDTSLHFWAEAAQGSCEVRQVPIQASQPDRDHVRKAQRLAARFHTLRQIPNGFLPAIARCNWQVLAIKQERVLRLVRRASSKHVGTSEIL